MLNAFFEPRRVVSLDDLSFTDSRELLRDGLREALGQYLNRLAAPENFAPVRARALLDRIHDDSSMGVLLSIVKSIHWDSDLRCQAIHAMITATDILATDTQGRDIRPTELSDTVIRNETTRTAFYEVAGDVLDSISSTDLARIRAYDDFFALRCLIVDAYKRSTDADFTEEFNELTRTAQTAVVTELRAYITEIDAKTEEAAAAGAGAEATLFMNRLTGTESGLAGKSCAEARLSDLEVDTPTNLGRLLFIARSTWGSHSNARIMSVLIARLGLIPPDRLTALSPEQLAIVYKLVQKDIYDALTALPESHRAQFGPAHLHHLKAKIEVDYMREPRLAIERAVAPGH